MNQDENFRLFLRLSLLYLLLLAGAVWLGRIVGLLIYEARNGL